MLRAVVGVAAMWAAVAMLVVGAGESAFAMLAGVAGLDADSHLVDDAADRPTTVNEIAALAREGTLRVSGRTCAGQMLGSGFVLQGLMLTNRHLVEGATEFKVDNPSAPSGPIPATLTAIHRRASELDLVSAAPVGAEILVAADENPEVGDLIYVAGHAGGGETLVVAGSVHLFDTGRPWGYGGEVMLLDVATTGGFSGGPVLDEEGRVVGMLQGFSPTLDLTIAIPVESLSTWVSGSGSAVRADCG